jgi:hypothetical protein
VGKYLESSPIYDKLFILCAHIYARPVDSEKVQKLGDNWTELIWDDLLYDIKDQKCIPFIGPGASDEWIHIREIAREWAKKYGYPYSLEDSSQLPRVSQFLAIQGGDESVPKKLLSRHLKEYLKSKPVPDFSLPQMQNNLYAVLADLHLPIYITTNYDHLMEQALKNKGKEPATDYSVWKELKDKELDAVQKYSGHTEVPRSDSYADFGVPNNKLPSKANPLVFHLLGDIDTPSSMVLTEKDYIDFAIYLSKMGDRYTLPHSIRQTLSSSTLLFIGYKLEDISFLIVFQGFIKLMSSRQPTSVAVQVQLPPEIDPDKKKTIQDYLDKFTESNFKMRIYWGESDMFLEQLRRRWLTVHAL